MSFLFSRGSPIQVGKLSKKACVDFKSSPIVVTGSASKKFEIEKAKAVDFANRVLSDMNQKITTEKSLNLLGKYGYDAIKFSTKTKQHNDTETDSENLSSGEKSDLTILDDIENVENKSNRIRPIEPKSASKNAELPKFKNPVKRPGSTGVLNKKPIDTGNNKITNYLISNFQYSNAENKFKKSTN